MKSPAAIARSVGVVAGPEGVAGMLDHRVLITAPTGHDADLAASFLTESGLSAEICRSVARLAEEYARGCGALLVAEEALDADLVPRMSALLGQQPTWSDLPVVVVTSASEVDRMSLLSGAVLGPASNITLLERPFRPATLVSIFEAALRARRRQYQVRDLVRALAASEARLRGFHESSRDWITELDLSGRALWMHGDPDPQGGSSGRRRSASAWVQRWNSRDRPALRAALGEARRGTVQRLQAHAPAADGSVHCWDVIIAPIPGAQGSPERLVATARDVSEGRRQQEALLSLSRQIEEQARIFNTTLSHIRDFAYILDRRGRFQYANRPLLELWGRELNEVVGRTFGELGYPPALAQRLAREIRQVVATGQLVRGEKHYTSPAGVVGHYEYILNPVLGADGRVELVAGSTREVTERILHEERLARSAQELEAQARLFDTTLSSITDLAYTFDLEGRWTYANRPLLRLWGRTLAEITGKSSLELGYPPELAERLRRQVKEVVRSRRAVKGETYFTDASGKEDYHEYIFSPVLDARGMVTAVCGTTRLTTERKRAEAAAAAHRRVLQLMVEGTPLPLVLEALMPAVEKAFRDRVRLVVLLAGPGDDRLRLGAASESLPASLREALAAEGGLGTLKFAGSPSRRRLIRQLGTEPFLAPHAEALAADGVKACALHAIPSSRGEALGWLLLFLGQARRATLEDAKVVDMAVRTASIAIERQRSEAALRNSERRYSHLVNSLPAAVYTTDAHGRITLFNEAAAALWGRRPEIERDLWCGSHRVYHVDGSPLALEECSIALCLREKRAVHGEEMLIERPDGSRRNVVPHAEPILGPDGRVEGAINMLLDVTETRRAEHASRHLAAIVESSDDAIISKDLNGIITSWNIGAERLFGYTAEETIGRSVTLLFPPDRMDEEPNILARSRRGERMEHLETVRRRKDGSLIEVSLTISPIRDTQGRIVGASKIVRDITKQNQAKRELERAHVELVAASRAKDDFLAALSHELRTPLNPVLLLASDAAMRPDLEPEVRALFATVRDNVELEARLIDDLLDITGITHGKLPLHMEQVDVHLLLREALAAVNPEIERKGITLATRLEAPVTAVRGDPVRLKQVFWNVLKNAVKFTPGGGRVSLSTSAQGESEIAIRVIDTGIGMTADELARVFDAFAQGDHARLPGSHRFGGLGLGLAISLKLVHMHAGSLRAASAGRDQGSEFVIHLPLVPRELREVEPPAPEKGTDASPERLPGVGLRVLLVEDHEPTRTALARLLVNRHFQVQAAGTLEEARACARAAEFDLLISDINLPDGDGADLMRELLREHPRLRGVALTGFGMEDDRERTRAAGFAAHLTKPVRVQALATVLKSLVEA